MNKKICSKCKEEKSLDDFNKDKNTKSGLSHYCRSCKTLSHRKWKENNQEKVSYYQKIYRESNKDNATSYKREWYLQNKDHHLEKGRLWREQNPTYEKSHYKKNRDYHITKALKRYLNIKYAFPKWANKEKIKEIYNECERLTITTGIQYHVDHIIPLKGKTVCGLHVETNLRIITAKENLQKQAKFIEELLCQS